LRIYITHCSNKKEPGLKNTSIEVSPQELYTATPTQRFIKTCENKNVNWAIFSDEYGIWFPDEKHIWYNKDPNTVNNEEFDILVEDLENKLNEYDEIFFYHNPGRFHRLYKKLLTTVKNKDKIKLISHLNEIK